MTHDRATRLRRGLVAGLAVLALAGCAAGTTPPAPSPTPTTHAHARATAANGADNSFVLGMIPHHRQAVAMSDLAATRAASPEVTDLAARISGAQGPEIDRMNALLAAWGTPPPAAGDMGGGMSGMSGMMGPEQMRGLEAARGPAFDRAFLQMMIEHHTGAIEMAGTELAQGRDPGAKDLARTIVDAQRAEIGEMQALLGRG